MKLPPESTLLPQTSAGLTEIIVKLPGNQSGYVKLTNENRRSEDEAVRRLLQIARETGGKRVVREICGWPALERQYRTKLAQVMGERSKQPLPEAPTVHAATVAIAEGDAVVRFEAALEPEAGPEGLGPIFGLARSVTCSRNPHPEQTKAIVEKLKQQLLQSPKGEMPPQAPFPGASNALSRLTPPASGIAQQTEARALERTAAGGGASVLTSLGTNWSEIQIAASSDSKTVVVGSNGGTAFSTDYGDSFNPSTVNFTFGSGDPTLATGASGQFYLGGINNTGAGCRDPVVINTTRTGSPFNFAGNAAACPFSGNGMCLADQPQMAADGHNAAASGDQVYVVWRNFPKPWWDPTIGNCLGIQTGSPTPTISCSVNNGTTWGHQTAIGSGDFGRPTVGPNGFVYVTYISGSNIMMNKFSSCASGLSVQPGFPVTVASFTGVDCPISGLDRCNSSSTASPQPAVSADNVNSVYVAYADKTSGSNDDIVVRHSRDGGQSWPDRNIANSSVNGLRFLPWVCSAGGAASVSWYDRRNVTMGDNSLTNYFFNQVPSGTEVNVSVTADSQNAGIAPGSPKYGDYNGNACTRDRAFVAWASGTPPPGVIAPPAAGPINVYVEAIPPGPPIIAAVAPTTTQCGSGTVITISGANFRNVGRIELDSGGGRGAYTLSTFTVNSTRQITATVPNNLAASLYEVVVFTPSGSSTQPVLSTRTDLFSVTPTITGLTPNRGPVLGGTQVTVTGTCFETATGFRFGSSPASLGFDQCASSTQCVVYSPAAMNVGTVDVVARVNGAPSQLSAGDRFTYSGPQITSISPANGPITGGTWVEIGGSGFPRYDGRTLLNTQLSFGGVTVMGQCDQNWCSAVTPASPRTGAVDVTANAFGATSTPSPGDVFTYTARPRLIRFQTPEPFFGVTGAVVLDGNAPGGGAVVALTSSNQSLVTVPANVTIPAGSTSAVVPTTINPSLTTQSVTLTASYDGVTLSGAVNIAASPALALGIDATALDAGQSASVSVTIATPAPGGGAVISLSSSLPSAIPVPATVTIPAGTYSTSFTVSNSYSGTPRIVTISASYNGATVSDSVLAPSRASRCPPRPCSAGFFWNPDTCTCQRGVPRLPQ